MARCVLTVVGMADRMKGTSKNTGKAYDLVEVAVTFCNQWGSNSVACSFLPGDLVDELDVKVGRKYDAVVNQVNGKSYIDLIDEVD